VTGTITHLHQNRGVGMLLGDDGKSYTFRRSDVREVWFHELTEGGTVSFEPGPHWSAKSVRPVARSV
jgi:cold shock CspA family protein